MPPRFSWSIKATRKGKKEIESTTSTRGKINQDASQIAICGTSSASYLVCLSAALAFFFWEHRRFCCFIFGPSGESGAFVVDQLLSHWLRSIFLFLSPYLSIVDISKRLHCLFLWKETTFALFWFMVAVLGFYFDRATIFFMFLSFPLNFEWTCLIENHFRAISLPSIPLEISQKKSEQH